MLADSVCIECGSKVSGSVDLGLLGVCRRGAAKCSEYGSSVTLYIGSPSCQSGLCATPVASFRYFCQHCIDSLGGVIIGVGNRFKPHRLMMVRAAELMRHLVAAAPMRLGQSVQVFCDIANQSRDDRCSSSARRSASGNACRLYCASRSRASTPCGSKPDSPIPLRTTRVARMTHIATIFQLRLIPGISDGACIHEN